MYLCSISINFRHHFLNLTNTAPYDHDIHFVQLLDYFCGLLQNELVRHTTTHTKVLV
jgi:hypothetical protein